MSRDTSQNHSSTACNKSQISALPSNSERSKHKHRKHCNGARPSDNSYSSGTKHTNTRSYDRDSVNQAIAFSGAQFESLEGNIQDVHHLIGILNEELCTIPSQNLPLNGYQHSQHLQVTATGFVDYKFTLNSQACATQHTTGNPQNEQNRDTEYDMTRPLESWIGQARVDDPWSTVGLMTDNNISDIEPQHPVYDYTASSSDQLWGTRLGALSHR